VLDDGEVDGPDDVQIAHDDDQHHHPDRDVAEVESHFW
jgi:hypothetical protein